MNTNEQPSMKTWQAETYTVWAVLAEIIAASDLADKIDWRRAEDTAQKMSHDDLRGHVTNSIRGMQEAVAAAKQGDRS